MRLHHGQHHASYVANLNSILEEFPDLRERSALWLLLNLDKLPQKIRTAVRNNAGGKLFGSGWVWLARAQPDGGRLEIRTTAGHDNPLMQHCFPLLLNDVWEHAYYLKHENRRADYLKGWRAAVNWEEAARRFERSDHSVERDWEAEGGSLLAVTT